MKGYQTRNSLTLRKRVKKAHAKAKFAGFLYLLGTLAMVAFACLPTLNLGGKDLWVLDFWKPFLNILKPERDIFAIIVAVLYGFVVLTGVINFLKCLGKTRTLFKGISKKQSAYNRNVYAMEEMGGIFSGSFAAIINFHFLIYILQPSDVTKKITIYAYAMLGVGLVIHFLAGVIGGKVSTFHIQRAYGTVEEEKRACGTFVYFFRNLIQIAATGAIVYFFVPVCTLNQTLATLLAKGNPFSGDLMKVILPLALQILLVLWILVLVKHSTASTEFNRFGIEGSGMKNYRVFAFFTVLTAGGAAALEYLATKAFAGVALKYAIIAGVAFAAFLVDCIFKSRVKEKEETEDEVEVDQFLMQQPSVQAPVAPTSTPTYQPVYIPVYYPYPAYQGGMPCPMPTAGYAPMPSVAPCSEVTGVCARPAPSPAPAHLKPTPSPAVQAAEGKKDVRAKRRDIKERDAILKREKAAAKKNKKIAKRNAKKEKRLTKQEESFVKKTAVTAVEFPKELAPETQVETPVMGLTASFPAIVNAPIVQSAPETVVAPPAPVEDEVKEITSIDPKKEWKVRCPRCGRELMVSERTPYHRCPNCDKVFQIRKFETFVKKA